MDAKTGATAFTTTTPLSHVRADLDSAANVAEFLVCAMLAQTLAAAVRAAVAAQAMSTNLSAATIDAEIALLAMWALLTDAPLD